MCVWLPATHLEPGRVAACRLPLSGILHVGRYPSGTDETAEKIAADLEKSAFLAPVLPDVMRWKYAKLLSNLGNALEAVCGPIDRRRGTRPAPAGDGRGQGRARGGGHRRMRARRSRRRRAATGCS